MLMRRMDGDECWLRSTQPVKSTKLQEPSTNEDPNTKLQMNVVSDSDIDWETEDSCRVRADEPVRHPFDLEERTTKFAERVIRYLKKIPREPVNDELVKQLARCAPSPGANYLEANDGVSKKDFRFSISRCVKEAKETKYFLRLLATAHPESAAVARELWREAKELHLIFSSMLRK